MCESLVSGTRVYIIVTSEGERKHKQIDKNGIATNSEQEYIYNR